MIDRNFEKEKTNNNIKGYITVYMEGEFDKR